MDIGPIPVQSIQDNPTLVSCFPLLVKQNLDFFEDNETLRRLSKTAHSTRVLGFFLELTGELAGLPSLVEKAKLLRKQLANKVELQCFFGKKLSKRARKVAERSTPETARSWGFLLNIGVDSFSSHLRKFS